MSIEQVIEIGGGWRGYNRSRGGLTHHLGGPGGGDSGSASMCSGLLLLLKRGSGHCLFLLPSLFFGFLRPCWYCSNVVEIGACGSGSQTLVCRAELMLVGHFCAGVNEFSGRGYICVNQSRLGLTQCVVGVWVLGVESFRRWVKFPSGNA